MRFTDDCRFETGFEMGFCCCRDWDSRMVEFLHWRNRWSCDWRIEGALGDPAVFTLPRLAVASRFFSAQKPAQLFYHLSSLIYHRLTNYMNYHGIISHSEGLSKKELVSQLRCKIYGNNYYEKYNWWANYFLNFPFLNLIVLTKLKMLALPLWMGRQPWARWTK